MSQHRCQHGNTFDEDCAGCDAQLGDAKETASASCQSYHAPCGHVEHVDDCAFCEMTERLVTSERRVAELESTQCHHHRDVGIWQQHLNKQQAEVDRLHAEVGRLKDCHPGPHPGCTECLACKDLVVEVHQAEVDRLRAALRRYGRHTTECCSRARSVYVKGPCNCDLDAALGEGGGPVSTRGHKGKDKKADDVLYDAEVYRDEMVARGRQRDWYKAEVERLRASLRLWMEYAEAVCDGMPEKNLEERFQRACDGLPKG